jgi:phosphoribosyl 1,2-cyclic phosphate phosphodiesterase
MRVVLLGTGGSAGVPMIGGADGAGDWGSCDPSEPRNRRSRSSITITGPAGTLLVDTGPDLRTQLLACKIKQVDAILYTHPHADHITGLDDVRILNRIAGRPLTAYGTGTTLAALTGRFPYAFRPWEPPNFFRPVMLASEVAAGDRLEILGMHIDLLDQDHGYSRTLGLRIGDFAYCTDVIRFDPATFERLRGLDTWVVDCFQRQPHNTHANLAQVLAWVRELRPQRTILTHLGTDMDWARLARDLPAAVEAGVDGLVLDFPANDDWAFRQVPGPITRGH